jgi:hypothetical protein
MERRRLAGHDPLHAKHHFSSDKGQNSRCACRVVAGETPALHKSTNKKGVPGEDTPFSKNSCD